MNSELVCQVEQAGPVAVVRPHGELRVGTAPALRAEVAKCLAEQPVGVLLDLCRLELGDEVALTVFPALSRRAAEWPGVPVALCCVPPEVFAPMARIGLSRHLSVFRDRSHALAELGTRPPPEQLREWYPPAPWACHEARQAVTAACRAWQLEDLTEIAALVVSELVANAVNHAGTPLQLTVALHDGQLCLSVRDGSTAPPVQWRRRRRRLEAPGGQGLVLVSEMATAWGHLSAAGGKVVWATLRARRSGAGRDER